MSGRSIDRSNHTTRTGRCTSDRLALYAPGLDAKNGIGMWA
jgi:hypothetical protein